MPLLTLSWLDRLATHKRLSSTTDDGYGDPADPYDTLASDVPIRIEQPELQAVEAPAGDVVRWTAWLLGTAIAPKEEDVFEVDDKTLLVDKVEDLTDLDGNLDHWQLATHEVKRIET